MPYEVLKYDTVDDEIETVIVYYETISFDLGLKFENEIINALNSLENHPFNYFNLEDHKHRRIIIHGFPYAFIYCVEENVVIIKMLFPQRQDPAKLWTRFGRKL